MMNRRNFLRSIGIAGAGFAFSGYASVLEAKPNTLPNIVYILADDMGYGDVSALNRESKIPTPSIDRLAKEGMVFSDGDDDQPPPTEPSPDDSEIEKKPHLKLVK